MDAEMRDHLAKFRLERMAAVAEAVMSGEKQRTCSNCGENIGYRSTAGLTIKFGNNVFCSEFCLEVFLDKLG